MTFVSFGLITRPAGIAWPSADPELRPVQHWIQGSLRVPTIHGGKVLDALIRGDLAIHPMVDDPGFAISDFYSGLRMTCGGRVFATSAGAAQFADANVADLVAFGRSLRLGPAMPEHARLRLCAAFDQAERDGLILADLVMVA